MTIAAGFVCKDGILFCADSQFSDADKNYRQKIIYRSLSHESAACFAFSGNEDYARSGIEDCREAMSQVPCDKQTVWTVRRTIRRALGRMMKEYNSGSYDPQQVPNFLISISTQTEPPALFMYGDYAMPPVDSYSFIGTGSSLGNYIVKAFRSSDFQVSIKEMIPIAMYAVAAARRHDLGCGGGAQFMAVRGMYASGLYGHDFETSAEHIKNYERLSGLVLTSIGNPDLPEEAFETLLAAFGIEVTKMRKSVHAAKSEYRTLLNVIGHSGPIKNLGDLRDPLRTTADPLHQPPSPESPGGSDGP